MTPVIFAAQSLLNEDQRQQTSERVVNMFPEPSDQGVALRSVPGLLEKVQLNEGRVRAFAATSDLLYAAVGGKLVSWDEATVAVLGDIEDGDTTMAVNTAGEVAIAANGSYYVWTGTDVVQPSGGAFGAVGSVDFVDGFFTRSEKDGFRWDITGLNDGASLNALDFASPEHKPDLIRRALVNSGFVWLFGERTVEVWQNVGSADFPFARLESTILEKGLRSALEAARLDNTIFWVSEEPRVYAVRDFAPVRSSTTAVEASLAKVTATTFTYQYQGQDFFVVRPADRPAWVYSPATQAWHERASGAGCLEAWEVTDAVCFKGTWYAGTNDGYLCTFSGFNDRGKELRREVVSRNLRLGGRRFRVNSAHVDVENGNGGSLMFSRSSDRGLTFTPERSRSLGAAGEYDREVKFDGLGQHRDFCMKLACTDNVDFAIYGASLDLK